MGDRAKQTNSQGSLFEGESSTALATPETIDLRPARISVERNIEAWPIFVPSDSRSAPKVRRLVRKIKVDDNSVIEASVLVSFAADLGMLTTDDQKVFYGLIRLWEEDGRPEKLTFSLRRLARTLKRSWGQKVPRILVNSLRRLADTPLTWFNAYHDSIRGRTLRSLESFKILSHLKIVESSDGLPRTTTEKCEVTFHPLVLSNLRNFHTKPVLYETAIGFESGIALLLYRHLDLAMADKTRYVRRSKELFEDLGLLERNDAGAAANQEYKYKSRRARTLERAFKEINGAQLTTGVVAAKLEPTKDGRDLNAVFTKRAVFLAPAADNGRKRVASGDAPPEASDDARDVVRLFYRLFHEHDARTINRRELKQAETLVADHGPDGARHVVEYAFAHTSRGMRPQFFGWVLSFADRAVADFERAGAERENDDATPQCELCEGLGRFWVVTAKGRVDPVGCSHNLEKIAEQLARQGLTLLPKPWPDE